MRNNQVSIGDAIREWITEKRLNEPILQSKIVEAWSRVMGEPIAKHTKNIVFRNGRLYITVSHPALKQELFYSRSTIMNTFNQEIKETAIQEVVIY